MCQWIINMWVSGGQKCKFFGKFCVGAKYINLINTGDIDFFFCRKTQLSNDGTLCARLLHHISSGLQRLSLWQSFGWVSFLVPCTR